jgi:hypothetical protein
MKKEFIVLVSLLTIFFVSFGGTNNKNNEVVFDALKPDLVDAPKNVIVAIDKGNTAYKISKSIWEMDPRLERTSDLLCIIDGVKYYLLD